MNGDTTVPLILSREPVSRGLLSNVKPTRPNVAVVYDDGFGNVACFDGKPLSWSQQFMSKYRFRSEVDISDHRRKAILSSSPLPAKGDAYYFETTVNVGFKVVSPEEIVRRNVEDALLVVYDFLLESFRPITRRHDIQDASGAEAEINTLFYQQSMDIPEGIRIFRCVVQLAPDSKARAHVQTLVDAQRQRAIGVAEQALAEARARGETSLAALHQDARLAGEVKEHAALAGRPLDLRGMLESHLAKHPDETSYALELLMRYEEAQRSQRDMDDQRLMDLVRFMAERDLIQAVDVDRLRSDALGRVQEITGRGSPALPAAAADGWDDELPTALTGQVVKGDSGPVGGARAGTAGPAAPAASQRNGAVPQQPDPAVRTSNALPVYVLVDESLSDAGYLAALNDGVKMLVSTLSATPEAVESLRLALLGYAEDVAVRMPMTTVSAGGYLPQFAARGPAGLAAALEYLLELIPQDVDRLKARGLAVNRPTVYLLCAGPVGDGDECRAQQRRLTDRASFRYAPNIVACGIGSASPALTAALATSPELGFCAPADLPLAEAGARYTRFLGTGLTRLAVAHVRGESDAVMDRPAGFLRPTDIQRGSE